MRPRRQERLPFESFSDGHHRCLMFSDLVAACAALEIDDTDLCGKPVCMRQTIDAHEAAAGVGRADRALVRRRLDAVRPGRARVAGAVRRAVTQRHAYAAACAA
jgi:hypothetical protein